MTHPKVIAVCASLTLLLALAATALAVPEPDMQVAGSVSPTNGGSPENPKNAKFKVSFAVNPLAKLTADKVNYEIPKNLTLDGTGFSYCTAAQIAANGVRSCPPSSQVGTGDATLLVGLSPVNNDFKIKVFAASSTEVALALYSGPFTPPPLTGIIQPPSSADFSQRLSITIPPALRQPIMGTYTYLTQMKLVLGAANPDETAFFATLTGCPVDKLHRFAVGLHFVPNPNPPNPSTQTAEGTSVCTGSG